MGQRREGLANILASGGESCWRDSARRPAIAIRNVTFARFVLVSLEFERWQESMDHATRLIRRSRISFLGSGGLTAMWKTLPISLRIDFASTDIVLFNEACGVTIAG